MVVGFLKTFTFARVSLTGFLTVTFANYFLLLNISCLDTKINHIPAIICANENPTSIPQKPKENQPAREKAKLHAIVKMALIMADCKRFKDDKK